MVVFTCNNCGDSLAKPKVAKHYQFQCRNPVFVTCVDCHKDFHGEEYTVHTKCVTENERYGGKNYVPAKNTNKGEKKQQAWINIVQNVLTNSKNLTAPERNMLNTIAKFENIPRKKPKFMNFINNMTSNKVNLEIVESIWNKMESALKEATVDNNTQKNENQNVVTEENQNNVNICKENNKAKVLDVTKEIEEIKKKKHKKSKKRLLENNENDNSQQNGIKKNKINKIQTSKETDAHEESVSKFSWKSAIIDAVTLKGEISLKKLRKKVTAQYLSNFPDITSEKAASKFEKKLLKVSNISIVENKVKLSLD